METSAKQHDGGLKTITGLRPANSSGVEELGSWHVRVNKVIPTVYVFLTDLCVADHKTQETYLLSYLPFSSPQRL